MALASVACAALMSAAPASAQVFGTYAWQMQPYCNVVTLTLTATPAGFALDGVDDQCGATSKASASGFASFAANGNITVNFTIVTAPVARAVQVSALVNPGNGSGRWIDSVGNGGALALGVRTGGAPRPLPSSGLAPGVITTTEIAPNAVGRADINTAEVQARVSGVCPAGQAMSGINANGSVTCEPVVSRLAINGSAFVGRSSSRVDRDGGGCAYNDSDASALTASFQVPMGYQITGLSARVYDGDDAGDATIRIVQPDATFMHRILVLTTAGVSAFGGIAGVVSSPRPILTGSSVFIAFQQPLQGPVHRICSVELTLTKS